MTYSQRPLIPLAALISSSLLVPSPLKMYLSSLPPLVLPPPYGYVSDFSNCDGAAADYRIYLRRTIEAAAALNDQYVALALEKINALT